MTETILERYRPGDRTLFPGGFPYEHRSRLGEVELSVLEAEAYAAEHAEKARQRRTAFDELLKTAGGDRDTLYEDAKRAWDAQHAQDGQAELSGA